ncbi:unnamed protein product [Arctogadus glacialis]
MQYFVARRKFQCDSSTHGDNPSYQDSLIIKAPHRLRAGIMSPPPLVPENSGPLLFIPQTPNTISYWVVPKPHNRIPSTSCSRAPHENSQRMSLCPVLPHPSHDPAP